MRVIVCGSRNWTDREKIAERLAALPPFSTVVHGCAQGADTIASNEARKLAHIVEPYLADWKTYGVSAGPIRNREMARAGADLCIAFWDGSSSGTGHMLKTAREAGIPVEIIS